MILFWVIEHVPCHRLKSPAEKKKFVRGRGRALHPVQFTIVSWRLNFKILFSCPPSESASHILKIKMAGQDKNKSKKAGRAKGEAAPVISEYRELLETQSRSNVI
jgi:hypothetical protein